MVLRALLVQYGKDNRLAYDDEEAQKQLDEQIQAINKCSRIVKKLMKKKLTHLME